MTYITRYMSPHRKPQLWTIDPEHLFVRYQTRNRPTGRSIGPFQVVESAGVDKSAVNLRAHKGLTSRGSNTGMAWLHVKLLDRHKSIRHLRSADAAVIAEIDERIAVKMEELKALREERHIAVEAAWKAGGKVDITELEEKAASHA